MRVYFCACVCVVWFLTRNGGVDVVLLTPCACSCNGVAGVYFEHDDGGPILLQPLANITVAPSNILNVVVIEAVSQPEMSWLKTAARWNMY